jgi:hypothetical protein
MSKRNQKTIDVAAIVKLFGGKHQIVNDYEKILRIILTVKAVEKWIERETISTTNMLYLKTIAERKNIEFNLESYIK